MIWTAPLPGREERTVTFNLTVQYDRVMFLLEPSDVTRGLARKRVSGSTISRTDASRSGITANRCPIRRLIVSPGSTRGQSSRISGLSEAVDLCRRIQANIPPKGRSRSAPRRSSQANHMFTPAEAKAPAAPTPDSSIAPIGAGGRLTAAMMLGQKIAAKLPARRRKRALKPRTGFQEAAE